MTMNIHMCVMNKIRSMYTSNVRENVSSKLDPW